MQPAPAGALARPALVRGGRLLVPGRLAVPRAAGRLRLHRHAAGGRRAWYLRQQESRLTLTYIIDLFLNEFEDFCLKNLKSLDAIQ